MGSLLRKYLIHETDIRIIYQHFAKIYCHVQFLTKVSERLFTILLINFVFHETISLISFKFKKITHVVQILIFYIKSMFAMNVS